MIQKLFATVATASLLLAPVLSVSAETISLEDRLIKGSGNAVYWNTGDRRYVFPNEETFYSWFSPLDFARVVRLPDAEIAAIRIGGNVGYRPGSRLVKITTDPRVYAIDNNNVIRPIQDEAVAVALYGRNWAQFIDDVPDAFFVSYTIGAPIRRASDFHPTNSLTPTADLR
jgi:hypothetical protein